MQLDYPFHFDGRGRTAQTTDADHLERVNRPTFGSAVRQLVFAPNSDALALATQQLVQGALQQWLGDLIQVQSVDVQNVDSTLCITIQYIVRLTQQSQVAQFTQGGGL
jgi:phage baseplate assembly protein W